MSDTEPLYQQRDHSSPKQGIDFIRLNGRSGGIRTHDPFTPSKVRYQAALRSDTERYTRSARRVQTPYEAGDGAATAKNARSGEDRRPMMAYHVASNPENVKHRA